MQPHIMLSRLLHGLLWPAAAAAAATAGTMATNSTCTVLGCGNHDSVCYCTPTCWSYGDCCADFQATCPPPPVEPLVLSDVNIVVTTDMHSWIEGRPHQPHLNATIADMVSMYEALKATAALQGKDVFLFDNGDINDGTGLSATAANHVDFLAPVLQQVMPFTARPPSSPCRSWSKEFI